MKRIAVLVLSAGVTLSLSAQDIQRLRLDAGYGGAPMLRQGYDGFSGIHVIVAAESPSGEFALHYVKRSMKGSYYIGPEEMSASTIALQYGASWKSSRAQFSISAGIGFFKADAKSQYYIYNFPNPAFFRLSSYSVSRIAFPGDMRICWNFSEHFGLGAAVFGAYVTDYSYVGFHGFVRVAL